jgi:hypothetical protein
MVAANPPKVPHILHESDVRKIVADVIEGSVGLTGPPIEDVAAPYTIAGVFSNTEVAAALDELGLTLNNVLTVLRVNGLIAPPEENPT